ncbi:MAG TPA: 4-hydroxyphenylacetate 3-monooxygenase, oxygenase component [Acetobacteraceae bacterium]|jgi:4-hydroxyphenylacetate 3-monooxygenase|nr:4-hydroxyphenylacetate 3-monooxygenase, oxygenase component [Acetobacteraceae bacterium]
MPARTGAQYLAGLRQRDTEVWLRGERVTDVTTHPGLSGGAKAIASLYDLQSDPARRDAMTFADPDTGDTLGLSFIIPRTQDDLVRRREMMLAWARTTCGMMGRSPDFMNVTFACWAGSADYFGRAKPEFADNMRRYYRYIAKNDLVLTHALINLQRSRHVSGMFNLQEGTALQVVKETSAGIIVRGARVLATLGPLADEIAVYSPRLAQHLDHYSPFALNFAISTNTPGLRFLCRDSFDHEKSHFDHPLGSRFEEMDSIVFFDDVLVPWERVFIHGDVGLLNNTASVTHSSAHTSHQGCAKNLAKCELVLGVALLMTETLGNAHLPHAEERIGELVMYTELMRACMRAAEADAQLDEWGVMCPASLPAETTRNLFMTAYPRMVEILQLLGSSSLMILPTEADMNGPLGGHIDQYLATDNSSARDRVKLFHLAWDISCSSFGSRQVLYERFFASDPLTRARALASIFPKKAVTDRVLDFLGRN